MRTFASWGSVALLAVLSIGPAPTAGAARLDSGAKTDSTPHFSLTVNRKTLISGQRLVATTKANLRCDWIVRWNGERRYENTKTLVSTFVAPKVTRKTKLPLHAKCFYQRPVKKRQPARATAAAAGGASQHLIVRVPPSWEQTVVITVLPPGTVVSPPDDGSPHPDGGLPNTGGPMLWLLLAGFASLLAGRTLVRRSRPTAQPTT